MNTTKTYSRKTDGNTKLTVNFKVSEFACRDGSDKILIDARLPEVLENIRALCGGKPVVINSGYRTAGHNKKCGGAANSQHLYGTAADIRISGVDCKTICKNAEKALSEAKIHGGIGLYTAQGFVHVDVREKPARWQNDGKGQYSVSGWAVMSHGTLKKGAKGQEVTALQLRLNNLLKVNLKVDGDFGPLTESVVKSFQKSKGLDSDGIVGPNTWAALGL